MASATPAAGSTSAPPRRRFLIHRHGQAQGFVERLTDSSSGRAPIGIELVWIPPGRFLMGSPPDEPERLESEGPQHLVQLQGFFMARTPITQAQWREVAGWEPADGESPWQRELNPEPSQFKGEQRPVERVSWHDAMEFCRRLSRHRGRHYTLPSESQWEYACRAGSTTPFHFGETITPQLANYDGNGVYGDGPKGVYRAQTTDVGSFPANAWGLHDMHGNVWEWCADQWHETYALDERKAPVDGSAWIDHEADAEQLRLLRGGSWDLNPRNCRSACRPGFHPVFRDDDIGFRVCCLPQDFLLNT